MPHSNPSSVLVLGAGELGLAILSALASHPLRHSIPITVLLRPTTIASNTSLTSHLSSLNISTLPCDIHASTASELSDLFKDCETIIGCTGMTSPPGTQLKICEAVLAAATARQKSGNSTKKTRYIPWQFGVDYDIIGTGSSQDLFTEQLHVRGLLRSQDQVRWVILSTGIFTSFLFEPAFGVVVSGSSGEDQDRKVVHALGSWEDNAVTVTFPADIGRVVAEVTYAYPDTQGVVYSAGDTVTYAQIAEILEKVTGKEVERRLWNKEFLKEELAKDPNNGMKKYRAVFAEGKGVSWEVEKTLNYEKGIKLQGVEEWVKENLRGRGEQ